MGKSAILESLADGNWNEESVLTGTFRESKKLLYNEIVEKYASDLEKFTNSNMQKNLTQNRIAELNCWDKRPILDIPNVKNHYDIQNRKVFSKKVQKWKGVVTQIFENYFEAKVYDLTNPSNVYEIAELETDEVSPDDKVLLKDGSIFYWTVGHFMENGQSVKKSIIRFQRLITIDENDINKIFDIVDSKFAKLKERKIDF